MEKGALIGLGRTAEVFAWGSDRVLKLYFDGMPRGAVEQEYHITRIAYAAGIPVPAADDLVESDGRIGIVFERVDGPSLLKSLGDHPQTILAGARLMGELHAKMHALSTPPDLPSQREQIRRGITRAEGLPDRLREASLKTLEKMPEGDRLCHGDFHPDNILLTQRGPVIIDWLTATRGNAIADVTRSVMILQTGGLPPNTSLLTRILINLSRGLLISRYVRRYNQIQPIPQGEMDRWQIPLLAARVNELDDYPQEKAQVIARLRQMVDRHENSRG